MFELEPMMSQCLSQWCSWSSCVRAWANEEPMIELEPMMSQCLSQLGLSQCMVGTCLCLGYGSGHINARSMSTRIFIPLKHNGTQASCSQHRHQPLCTAPCQGAICGRQAGFECEHCLSSLCAEHCLTCPPCGCCDVCEQCWDGPCPCFSDWLQKTCLCHALTVIDSRRHTKPIGTLNLDFAQFRHSILILEGCFTPCWFWKRSYQTYILHALQVCFHNVVTKTRSRSCIFKFHTMLILE